MATSKITITKVCECCGKEFETHKITTRYCSKACNNKVYKENLRKAHIREAMVKETGIQDLDYMSVREAAARLGINRRSVYNLIYKNKLHAARLSLRTTKISRSDIDRMLEENTYRKFSKPVTEPEYYTTAEITEKYSVKKGMIYYIAEKNNIPKSVRDGITLWSKSHIDRYFSKNRKEDPSSDWYSISDIMEKYNMTLRAAYSFVSMHNFHKKKINHKAYYSKKEVDIAKGVTTQEYYTAREIADKYHISVTQVYHYTKSLKIPSITEGKFTKYSREETDKALSFLVV